MNEDLDFWQVEFPPPQPLEERPLELQLECTACGNSVTVVNGDSEFDVCAIHGGLVRYCSDCGYATVWSRPNGASGAAAERRRAQESQKPARRSAQVEPLPLQSTRGAELPNAGDPEVLHGGEAFVRPK